MVDRESILSVRENGASGFEPNELRFRKLAARFIMHSVLATVAGILSWSAKNGVVQAVQFVQSETGEFMSENVRETMNIGNICCGGVMERFAKALDEVYENTNDVNRPSIEEIFAQCSALLESQACRQRR